MPYSSKFNILNIASWRLATDEYFTWKETQFFNDDSNETIREKDMVNLLSLFMNQIKRSKYRTRIEYSIQSTLIAHCLDRIAQKVPNEKNAAIFLQQAFACGDTENP